MPLNGMIMRLGAVLISGDGRAGFRISDRKVLTVGNDELVTLADMEDFAPEQVFCCGQTVTGAYEPLMEAANMKRRFRDSFEMVGAAMNAPVCDLASLKEFMKMRHGAEPIPFGRHDAALDQIATNNWRTLMEKFDLNGELNRKFEEAETFNKRPNILVAGYTGSGKTSLIRTILGDLVPKNGIDNSAPKRMEFDQYESESICLWDSKGLELGDAEAEFCERTRGFIAERQDHVNVDEHIHLVWYLIQGPGARVTECDRNLIQHIFNPEHVIVVISKKDIINPKQFDALVKVLTDAGVRPEQIIAASDTEGGSVGCKELVELSNKILPEAYRDAFMAAQEIDRDAKVQATLDKTWHAKNLISCHIDSIRKAAEVPVAASDAAILLPPLGELTAVLAALYGVREPKFREEMNRFLDGIIKSWIESDSEITASDAAILGGALGYYLKNNFESNAIARIKGAARPDLGLDLEAFKQFHETYQQGATMKPNILVCGKTGVGKTSLIQAVTHRGTVPDAAIGNGEATTEGFDLYETEIANFIDSEGMNPGTQSVDEYADFILGEVLHRLDSDEEENLIHNIWYCIDGSGARVQEADARLIRTFSDNVLLVVTKSELMRKEQAESMMNSLLKLIDRDRIVMVSAENKSGLKQLLAKTEKISMESMAAAEQELDSFRERWDDYYGNMLSDWTSRTSDEADEYIYWGAGRAAAIALIPIPLADITPLVINEGYMVYRIAGVYGYAIDKTIISMLIGVTGASITGKVLASFLPVLKIPIAAGITYGLGVAAKAFFESEMTLTPGQLKDEFLTAEKAARKMKWQPVDED
jgi:predicted GTPase/uncharacterized protein (DUF697 family)